jgi:membrane-associated protease RseP (regulator of RpoE activity)
MISAIFLAMAVQSADPTAQFEPAPAALVAGADADATLQNLAENAIRAQLVDPDSARFKWAPQGWSTITDLHHGIFGKTIKGPMLLRCGLVNSRNRMGGFAGYAAFDVAIKDGVAVSVDIDESTGYLHLTSDFCRKTGFDLSSATAITTPDHPASAAFAPAAPLRFGAFFVDLPQAVAVAMQKPDLKGVFVVKIDPASAAEAAGLKAGDTIVAFGGRPITSSNEMRQAVAASDALAPVALKVVRAGQEIELHASLR